MTLTLRDINRWIIVQSHHYFDDPSHRVEYAKLSVSGYRLLVPHLVDGLYDRLLRTWEEAYDQEQDGEGRP